MKIFDRPLHTGTLAVLALTFLATPPLLNAQMDHEGMDHDMGTPPGLEAAARQYESVRDYLMTAAERTPEELYGYRPTEEVRSLGELYGHVANAQYAFCSAVLEEDAEPFMNLEEGTKEQIVSGLRDGFEFCDRAYSDLGPQELHEEVTLFGSLAGPRIWVLVFNATHNWEHYGNVVTYLRMNGLVPPSSGGMQDGM